MILVREEREGCLLKEIMKKEEKKKRKKKKRKGSRVFSDVAQF